MEEYSSILKQRDLKVTPQRIAILAHLMNSRAHPTAEVIYNDLIKTYPSMSLATVYKTLETLKNEGIILEINMGEDAKRYDSTTDSHAHFMCLSCKSVIDICLPGIFENIDAEVSVNHNVSILDKRMSFYGYCGNCKDILN